MYDLKDVWNFEILKLSEGSVTVSSLVIGLGVLALGLIVAKAISRKGTKAIDRRFQLDKSSSYLIERVFFYVLALFTLLFAMKFAHIPLTIFTVLGGAAAIGVGFGSQNLVNNFLSGLILMIERPIKVGDFIEVDGLFGEVQEIGMRSTSIIIFGNRHIVVPNSSFLEKNVLNWTRKDKLISTSITVGVNYGSDTELVKKLLVQAVESIDEVLKGPDREPEAFFIEFGDNSLNFQIYFWLMLESLVVRRRTESKIRFEIDRLFRENNVVIAFPQRDVHLYSSKPIDVKVTQ